MKELIRGMNNAKNYALGIMPQFFDHIGFGHRVDVYLAIEGARYLSHHAKDGLSSLFLDKDRQGLENRMNDDKTEMIQQ